MQGGKIPHRVARVYAKEGRVCPGSRVSNKRREGRIQQRGPGVPRIKSIHQGPSVPHCQRVDITGKRRSSGCKIAESENRRDRNSMEFTRIRTHREQKSPGVKLTKNVRTLEGKSSGRQPGQFRLWGGQIYAVG